MRIAKYIAAAGICSRRDAEKYIISGRVAINNQVINSPAINIITHDIVTVDGNEITLPDKIRLWLYHKPVGLITSHSDELGRQNVFETLQGLPRVISVGRLDLNSEGLLLLTNSGELARLLELPSNTFDRIYKVRAYGDCRNILRAINKKNGLLSCRVDGINYQFKNIASTDSNNNKNNRDSSNNKSSSNTGNNKGNNWFKVTLQEGKNREIRRVFEHFGLQVNRLIRTGYAGFSLGKLAVGQWQEVEVPSNLLQSVLVSKLNLNKNSNFLL